MALTKKQRADIARLRSQFHREDFIATKLGIPVEEVRGAGKRGRPKNGEPTDCDHAKDLLKKALKETAISVRFKKVKCILANFGDLLGLKIEDAPKLIADHLKKSQK